MQWAEKTWMMIKYQEIVEEKWCAENYDTLYAVLYFACGFIFLISVWVTSYIQNRVTYFSKLTLFQFRSYFMSQTLGAIGGEATTWSNHGVYGRWSYYMELYLTFLLKNIPEYLFYFIFIVFAINVLAYRRVIVLRYLKNYSEVILDTAEFIISTTLNGQTGILVKELWNI